ncbi:MAG TPA: methyltransferase domain-containing protein [Ktedonobacterales bacterium]|nr:methyltransferase domain-containing protein [Ktedonobacterales bacterium]
MNKSARDTSSVQIVSAYAELHKADWIPTNYDENIYNPGGYDSFAWDLYRRYLAHIVRDMASKHNHVKYLDFACGTGRITAALEHLTTEAVGLDISPQMIAAARRKVAHSTLRCGDILAEPAVVDFDYDLITAFRFFLNTEPEMRLLIMRSLASRLADQDSRLIFNIHANSWGINGIKSLYRRSRGWEPVRAMSYADVCCLVQEAGLVIESWYGFALWPDRVYRGRLSPFCKELDRLAARVRPLRWISKDMLFVCRPQAHGKPNGTDGKVPAHG